MKPRRRALVAGMVLLGFVAVPLFGYFCYQERAAYKCASCQSMCEVDQWRLGQWGDGSLPLTSERVRIRPTHLCREIFAPNHQHDWELLGRSPYYFFGTTWGGCAVGGAEAMNDFAEFYEVDADLRRVTRAAIDSGRVSTETLRQIAALPPWYDLEDSAAAEVSAMVDLARGLFAEAGLGWLSEEP